MLKFHRLIYIFLFVAIVSGCDTQDGDSKNYFKKLENEFSQGSIEVSAKDLSQGEWDEVCLIEGDDSGPTSKEVLNDYLAESGNFGPNNKDYSYYIIYRTSGAPSMKTYGGKAPLHIKGDKFYFSSHDGNYTNCESYESAKFRLVNEQVKLIQLR